MRFAEKFVRGKNTECWNWEAGVTSMGYGWFYDGNRMILAHRFSYEEKYGKIPDGLLACHKCDNPRCVNPDHVFVGTQKDNMRDASRKNRLPRLNPAKGEQNGNSKLTNRQVEKIKIALENGTKGFVLAKEYRVHHSVIYGIRDGKSWRSVKV